MCVKVNTLIEIGHGYKIEYASDREEKLLSEIVPEIIKALNGVTYFWVDFGSSVYDIHFEFKTERYPDEPMDLYFKAEQNELTVCYFGINGNSIFDQSVTSKLIEIINMNKNEVYIK